MDKVTFIKHHFQIPEEANKVLIIGRTKSGKSHLLKNLIMDKRKLENFLYIAPQKFLDKADHFQKFGNVETFAHSKDMFSITSPNEFRERFNLATHTNKTIIFDEAKYDIKENIINEYLDAGDYRSSLYVTLQSIREFKDFNILNKFDVILFGKNLSIEDCEFISEYLSGLIDDSKESLTYLFQNLDSGHFLQYIKKGY